MSLILLAHCTFWRSLVKLSAVKIFDPYANRDIVLILTLENHLIRNASNSIYLNLNHILILQESIRLHEKPHPTRSTSHDNRPLPQRRSTCQMNNDFLDSPNHVICSRLLSFLSIDLGCVMQLLRIYALGKKNTWSNWREPVERFSIRVLFSGYRIGNLKVSR
jgi:hypothetical protein